VVFDRSFGGCDLERVMRKVPLALVCLAGAAIGFWGTLMIIDDGVGLPFGSSTASANSAPTRKAALTVAAVPAKFGGGSGAALRPLKDGIELKSTFDTAVAAGTVEGAAYLHVEGPEIPPMAGRKVTLELDASADGAVADQNTEFQFVQNGLGQSGWKRFPLKAGRHAYRFDYAAPSDDRPPSRIDTFWVRSDAEGKGRPLVVHAVRLYLE
jgi:hypothetical protein